MGCAVAAPHKNEGLCRRLQALAVPTPAARHCDDVHFGAFALGLGDLRRGEMAGEGAALPGTLLISGARGGGSARLTIARPRPVPPVLEARLESTR